MSMNLMLDLETWGTEPGCDARSIGACVFDPMSGFIADGQMGSGSRIEQSFYLALDNPMVGGKEPLRPNYWDDTSRTMRRYPLTRDPSTVQWWSEQSDEARAAFADPVDMYEGLLRFAVWLCSLTGTEYDLSNEYRPADTIRIWAHGPQFDISILASWYRAVGLPVPWHYRAPRDTRTIMEAAGMDPHKGLEMFSTGTHHNALDDCITQARAVCAAYKVIRSGQPDHDLIVRKCAKIARDGCLVPPDGGSPTNEEADLCDSIADSILSLIDRPPPGDPSAANESC